MWLCPCPMWVLWTYSLTHICTPQPARSPQDTLSTQCSQYPYPLHTCCFVPNAHVSTSHSTCLQRRHICTYTQTHNTQHTFKPHLHRHCRHCPVSADFYPQPVWIAEGEICFPGSPCSWLFIVIQKKVDIFREKPNHAELWGPSKKLDHLTEMSSHPLIQESSEKRGERVPRLHDP